MSIIQDAFFTGLDGLGLLYLVGGIKSGKRKFFF